MSNPNPLIDVLVAQATLSLQANIADNNGEVDIERYQNELAMYLSVYIKPQNEDFNFERWSMI